MNSSNSPSTNEPLPSFQEWEELLFLRKVLQLRHGYLKEDELWAICRETCLFLQSLDASSSALCNLYVSPETMSLTLGGGISIIRSDVRDDDYLPPDQPKEKPISPKAHIFSLGQTLLTALEKFLQNDTSAPVKISSGLLALVNCMIDNDPQSRLTIDDVICKCNIHLKRQSSKTICRRLVVWARRKLPLESVQELTDAQKLNVLKVQHREKPLDHRDSLDHGLGKHNEKRRRSLPKVPSLRELQDGKAESSKEESVPAMNENSGATPNFEAFGNLSERAQEILKKIYKANDEMVSPREEKMAGEREALRKGSKSDRSDLSSQSSAESRRLLLRSHMQKRNSIAVVDSMPSSPKIRSRDLKPRKSEGVMTFDLVKTKDLLNGNVTNEVSNGDVTDAKEEHTLSKISPHALQDSYHARREENNKNSSLGEGTLDMVGSQSRRSSIRSNDSRTGNLSAGNSFDLDYVLDDPWSEESDVEPPKEITSRKVRSHSIAIFNASDPKATAVVNFSEKVKSLSLKGESVKQRNVEIKRSDAVKTIDEGEGDRSREGIRQVLPEDDGEKYPHGALNGKSEKDGGKALMTSLKLSKYPSVNEINPQVAESRSKDSSGTEIVFESDLTSSSVIKPRNDCDIVGNEDNPNPFSKEKLSAEKSESGVSEREASKSRGSPVTDDAKLKAKMAFEAIKKAPRKERPPKTMLSDLEKDAMEDPLVVCPSALNKTPESTFFQNEKSEKPTRGRSAALEGGLSSLTGQARSTNDPATLDSSNVQNDQNKGASMEANTIGSSAIQGDSKPQTVKVKVVSNSPLSRQSAFAPIYRPSGKEKPGERGGTGSDREASASLTSGGPAFQTLEQLSAVNDFQVNGAFQPTGNTSLNIPVPTSALTSDVFAPHPILPTIIPSVGPLAIQNGIPECDMDTPNVHYQGQAKGDSYPPTNPPPGPIGGLSEFPMMNQLPSSNSQVYPNFSMQVQFQQDPQTGLFRMIPVASSGPQYQSSPVHSNSPGYSPLNFMPSVSPETVVKGSPSSKTRIGGQQRLTPDTSSDPDSNVNKSGDVKRDTHRRRSSKHGGSAHKKGLHRRGPVQLPSDSESSESTFFKPKGPGIPSDLGKTAKARQSRTCEKTIYEEKERVPEVKRHSADAGAPPKKPERKTLEGKRSKSTEGSKFSTDKGLSKSASKESSKNPDEACPSKPTPSMKSRKKGGSALSSVKGSTQSVKSNTVASSPSRDSGVHMRYSMSSGEDSYISGGVRPNAKVKRVMRHIQHAFAFDGYLENGVEDLHMAEYISSLANLRWSTFENAITEKFCDLYWEDELLDKLYEIVNGEKPDKVQKGNANVPSDKRKPGSAGSQNSPDRDVPTPRGKEKGPVAQNTAQRSASYISNQDSSIKKSPRPKLTSGKLGDNERSSVQVSSVQADIGRCSKSSEQLDPKLSSTPAKNENPHIYKETECGLNGTKSPDSCFVIETKVVLPEKPDNTEKILIGGDDSWNISMKDTSSDSIDPVKAKSDSNRSWMNDSFSSLASDWSMQSTEFTGGGKVSSSGIDTRNSQSVNRKFVNDSFTSGSSVTSGQCSSNVANQLNRNNSSASETLSSASGKKDVREILDHVLGRRDSIGSSHSNSSGQSASQGYCKSLSGKSGSIFESTGVGGDQVRLSFPKSWLACGQEGYEADVLEYADRLSGHSEQSIEKKLLEVEQQITMEKKMLSKTEKFYSKLQENQQHKGADNKTMIAKVGDQLREMITKITFLNSVHSYLELLYADQWGLDLSLLYSLVNSLSDRYPQLKPQSSNPLLQFITSKKRNVLQAGKPSGLISYLYARNAVVEGYLYHFFYSYRYFATSRELLQLIAKIFSCAEKLPQSSEDLKRKIICRTTDILRVWVSGFFDIDLKSNHDLQYDLISFISDQVMPVDPSSQEIIQLIDGKQRLDSNFTYMSDVGPLHAGQDKAQLRTGLQPLFSSKQSKDRLGVSGIISCFSKKSAKLQQEVTSSYLPTFALSKDGFLLSEHTSLTLAQQLTLMQQDQFQSVHAVFYLNSRSRGIGVSNISEGSITTHRPAYPADSGESPSLFIEELNDDDKISKLLEHAKEISHWVSAEVVSCSSSKVQLALLSKFITASKSCYDMRNFATSLQIMEGLDNVIVRQVPAWRSLPSKILNIYEEIQAASVLLRGDCDFLIKGGSYKTNPTLPSTLLFLMHIQQLEIGGFQLANEMFKWTKMKFIASLVDQIRIFQGHSYSFMPDDQLQRLLQERIKSFIDADIHILAARNLTNFHQLPTEKSSKKFQNALQKVKANLK